VENTHLPSDSRERLRNEEVSLDELRSLLDYLRHICECTERKMKQFIDAEQDPENAYRNGSTNVSFKNVIYSL
jgi:hypothetical protein